MEYWDAYPSAIQSIYAPPEVFVPSNASLPPDTGSGFDFTDFSLPDLPQPLDLEFGAPFLFQPAYPPSAQDVSTIPHDSFASTSQPASQLSFVDFGESLTSQFTHLDIPPITRKSSITLDEGPPDPAIGIRQSDTGVVTYYNPHIALPLPENTELLLACKAYVDGKEKVRCLYIDPFQPNQDGPVSHCDLKLINFHGWDKHFKIHALREKEYLEKYPDASDKSVALKDRSFRDIKFWTCNLCGARGNCSRQDSMKRHQSSQRCRRLSSRRMIVGSKTEGRISKPTARSEDDGRPPRKRRKLQ